MVLSSPGGTRMFTASLSQNDGEMRRLRNAQFAVFPVTSEAPRSGLSYDLCVMSFCTLLFVFMLAGIMHDRLTLRFVLLMVEMVHHGEICTS